MLFPDSFLNELAERNDIAEVVGDYVKLTKRSGANLFGLCPFHSEKTPSFSVSPDKQIYHCFGCGKGGGVINFIMEIENLSFVDAVHFLARRSGMEVPESGDDTARQRRERMLSLNRDAARFFHSCLKAPGGQPARDYIQRRKISPQMVTAFGLGYAPDSWDSLRKAMQALGYTDLELFDAGLMRRGKDGRGGYDTFRNRLMFPVIDVRGNVIGFSGRILGDGEPKYMNSPETLVFNKSRNLFAMNLAKKSKNGYIILAEGNVDVVALHQAGFDSAVASLGTSLTPEQARLISRYAGEVVIAYDSDGAGQKASQRAISILEKLGIKVRVLRMQGAKDPDEFISTRGADAFKLLLEKSENHVEYRLKTLSDKFDLSQDAQKVQFLQEAARMLAELSSSVEREVYTMKTADSAGISRAVLTQEVERARRLLLSRYKKQHERESTRPDRSAQPAVKSIRYANTRSARAEEGILRILVSDPQLFAKPPILPEDFSDPTLARLYGKLLENRDILTPEKAFALLGSDFSSDEISHFSGIMQTPEASSAAQRALEDYINVIKEEKNASSETDPLAFAELMRNKKGYGG